MTLIDFDQHPHAAFKQGFLKGLGAPVILFGHFEAPPIQEIAPIETTVASDADALARDWLQVGNDMRAALVKYGQDR